MTRNSQARNSQARNSQARNSRRTPEPAVVTDAPGLVVIQPVREWICAQCRGTGDLLIIDEPGPLCLPCAELDHLVFLPAGDAALTRRAKKASGLLAVVIRWSRSRKRYARDRTRLAVDRVLAAWRGAGGR